jgi:hypothetical protein
MSPAVPLPATRGLHWRPSSLLRQRHAQCRCTINWRLSRRVPPLSPIIITFQTQCDALAVVGQPLNGFEIVSFLLAGLRSDFDPFVTSVTTRAEPLFVDEIYGHLLSHEMRLEQHQASLDLSVAGANVATRGYSPNHPSQGMRSSHGHNSGRSFSSGTSRPFRGRGQGSSGRGFPSSNSHSN